MNDSIYIYIYTYIGNHHLSHLIVITCVIVTYQYIFITRNIQIKHNHHQLFHSPYLLFLLVTSSFIIRTFPVKSPTLLVKSPCWLIYDDYINYIRNVRFHPISLKALRKWWSGSILDDREKNKHGNWSKYLYVNQQRWWFNQQETTNMVIEPTIMGSETTSNFWFCRTLGYTVPLFFPRWQNYYNPLDFDQQWGVKQQTWI